MLLFNSKDVLGVTVKPRDAGVKFYTCRIFRRHRAVLPVIARLSCIYSVVAMTFDLVSYRPRGCVCKLTVLRINIGEQSY